MTPDEVQRRVDVIRSMTDDNEAAHLSEDSLWNDVLQAFADGRVDSEEVSAVALEALAVREIDYDRWYA